MTPKSYLIVAVVLGISGAAFAAEPPFSQDNASDFHAWARAALLGEPPGKPREPIGLELRRQDYGKLGIRRSCIDTPMQIGQKRYKHGLGSHSISEIAVYLPEPAARFEAEIGIDNDRNTFGREGTVVFLADADGKELYRSPMRRGSDAALPIRVDLAGRRRFTLRVLDADDGPSCDHGDWADAAVVLASGQRRYLDELPLVQAGTRLATTPPFAFQYGKRASREFMAGWKRSVENMPSADGRKRFTVRYVDPATGLELTNEVLFYDGYPAAEWMIFLRNTGSKDTPILEDIRPLDLHLSAVQGGEIVLHYANGSTCSPTDNQPFDQPLEPKGQIVLQPVGGRSSNGRLPFFNLDWGSGGLVGAIGWSGQWQLRAARDAGNRVTLQAGQQTTHFVLRPGECVRTPRILLVGWSSNRFDGHNALRRIVYRYHTPLLAGQRPLPPTQCNTWFPVGDDGGKANEANQVALLEAYKGLGIEYLVMDAGWYGVTANWAENTGTWTPRKDTFPRGLKPVGEAARRSGIRFGMWFEPERVVRGTQLDREHPAWLLKIDEPGNRLLNLGLPAAQQWFIDMVSRYIDEVPLGYFRHDFNIDPLPFWQKADAPDRQGITEIRYIEGLYKVWDALRARYPELLMEGCASGGRRIDLESIGRFHTYWKTDLYGNLSANQSHVWGANLYLPAHLFNTPLFDVSENPLYPPSPTADTALFDMRSSPYAFRSLIGGALCAGWDPRIQGFDRELAAARIREFKALRHLTVGDFYPLLPYTLQPDQWIGYQFHRDDLDEGLALAFRREKSPYAAVDVRLQGLKPKQVYELTFADGGPARRATGEELARPLRITIDRCPGSAMIRYKPLARN
jgi:alpha-galactosidase